jgi:NTE family protein
MSLPAISPRYEPKISVDGGLLNNLPVDVVKKMGADIVIAVHLNPPHSSEPSDRCLRS